MAASVSLLPPMVGAGLPGPVGRWLSDDDQALIAGLVTKLSMQAVYIQERWQYYDGLQQMRNLGISIPPTLAGVRTVVDWPRGCVDPILPRCTLDGFRLAGATDVDDELQTHFEANDLGAELPLAFLDSFVAGRGYIIVGAPDTPGDSPIVTVESPLNLAMTWDPRTRKGTAAYQAYEVEGVYRAVLYRPDRDVFMSRDQQSTTWTVDNVDEHGSGELSVVRLPNRGRTSDREGRSEITAAVMDTTDSACRTLLGMEIGREFYSVPHRYIIGAAESNFQDAAGNPKSSWDIAMTKMLGLEADADGNMPTVGQFTAYDPSVFTKIIDEHAQLMASYTGFPPSYFGQTTSANPASADAIRVSENGLIKRAEQAQGQFTGPLRQMMRLVWRFANGGKQPPAEVSRMDVDWRDPATPTPAATTDSIAKQVAAGIIPATSDVTLSALRWNAVQRARLEADRKVDVGAQVLAELSQSLQAKEARADTAIAHAINPASVKATATNPNPNDGTGSNG